jgi:hypothetical protein
VNSRRKILLWIILGILSTTRGVAQEVVEREIRRQLDRLFYSEQYILDFKRLAMPAGQVQGLNDEPLPGLSIIPSESPSGVETKNGTRKPEAVGKMEMDILVIFDTSVTAVRQQIAEEVIKRHLKAIGVEKKSNLEFRRQPILKVMPKDLVPPSARGDSNPAPSAPASTLNPMNNPEGKQNFWEFIEHKKELASKVLVALWTAVASLVALFVFLTRLRSPAAVKEISPQSERPPTVESPALGPAKNALKKDELFSADENTVRQIHEIVQESQNAPHKVATILGRWLEVSDDKAKYGSFFLKNCDIKTTEAICKHLHPSDIDRLVSRNIGDFDPFSDENRRTIQFMRNDLAIMAAQQTFKEKAQPLLFLRTVPDEDLVKTLEKCTLHELAMVATLLPAHRIARVIEHHGSINYAMLLSEVSKLGELSPEHFEPLKKKLQDQIEQLSTIVVSKDEKIGAIKQILNQIKDPHLQSLSAQVTYAENLEYYTACRPYLTLYLDLLHLPLRALKIFLRSIDGEALGVILSQTDHPLDELMELMPEAIRQQFQDSVKLIHSPQAKADAWKNLVANFDDLKLSGLITPADLQAARAKTDTQFKMSYGENDNNKAA